MLLMALKLWHVDVSQRAKMESVVFDLLLEKEVEGHRGPVTACHIITEGGGRGGRGDLRSGFRRGQKPVPNREQRSQTCAERSFRRQFTDRNRLGGDIGRTTHDNIQAPEWGRTEVEYWIVDCGCFQPTRRKRT